MRPEWRFGLVAVLALTAGTAGARYYAQLAVPYYAGAAGLIARLHPWRVVSLKVTNDPRSHGTIVLLKGEVFRNPADPSPAAVVVSRVQVGEVVETPLIFWTVLLLWPAASTQRWSRLAMGIPVFLVLEALTTVCQLIQPMAAASAMLAGDSDPLTLLDRWSRFLEAGGRFVMEIVAALLTIAIARSFGPSSSAHRTVIMGPYFRRSHNS
jgi:hypothetical protein